MVKPLIQRIMNHMFWADERVLEALRAAGRGVEPARRLFAHVLAGQQLWFARIQESDTPRIEVRPDLSLDECEALSNQNAANYRGMLDRLPELDFQIPIAYTDSRGKSHTTAILDILTHTTGARSPRSCAQPGWQSRQPIS